VLVIKETDNRPDIQKIDSQISACGITPSVQKQSIINSLVYKIFIISDKKYLQAEFNHLILTLQQNGHNKKDINKIISKKQRKKVGHSKTNKHLVILTYVKDTTYQIGRS